MATGVVHPRRRTRTLLLGVLVVLSLGRGKPVSLRLRDLSVAGPVGDALPLADRAADHVPTNLL